MNQLQYRGHESQNSHDCDDPRRCPKTPLPSSSRRGCPGPQHCPSQAAQLPCLQLWPPQPAPPARQGRWLLPASPCTAHRAGTAARGREQKRVRARCQRQTRTHLQGVRYGGRRNSRRRMESLSVCLFLHRRRSSTSEQRWHRRHASPFRQPPSFQNHAQGRQSPVPCTSEPAETDEDIPAAPPRGGTPPSSLPPGMDGPSRP